MRTCKNIVGTQQEQRKSSTPTFPKRKQKKHGPWGMLCLLPSWLEGFFFVGIPMFFGTFLTQANGRVKTIGDIIKENLKNSKFLDQSCFLGSWVNGLCAKFVRSRNISHKLVQFKIPSQIFIHLHFIGPSSLQALCKVTLYTLTICFLFGITCFLFQCSWAFKLQCEGGLKVESVTQCN